MNEVDQLDVLTSGCDSIYTLDELRARITAGQPLRVKLGMDPTAPDLTLGHAVVLRKLRQFQDFGHKAVLIIGDYTAMIGDPSGKSKTRPMLSEEQIYENAQTYFDQAGKILDLARDKLEVRRNSEWLSEMSFASILRLMGQVTVARMMERDTFATRTAEGKEVYLHELLYPLMQGYDSVMVESDVELGGTDQTFNNLCGRDLQRNAGQPPQVVMVMPLLVGTDGTHKMSKSLGNYIAITDSPSDMFGKIMRIPDEQMQPYFSLLTDIEPARIDELSDAARTHPRQAKEILARDIIARYHSDEAAAAAAVEFARVHGGGGGGLPDEVPDFQVSPSLLQDGRVNPIDLAVECGFAKSRKDARRLISEHGLRLNGEVIGDPHEPVAVKSGDILQRGKRQFVRLKLP